MSRFAYWSVNTSTREPMNFMEQSGVWNIGDRFQYADEEYEVVDYAEEISAQEIEMAQRDKEWRG